MERRTNCCIRQPGRGGLRGLELRVALSANEHSVRQYTMVKKHQYLENGIVSQFGSSDCNVIFESEADIQGSDKKGCKVIGEFKSEAEYKRNYSWWSDWKDRLEHTYSANFSTMRPKNKRWIAVVDGQLRDYCQLENTNTGYLVVEKYVQINTDIIDALNFLISENKINSFSGPTNDSQGVGYYRITYW